jgi:hypothetical protein
MRPFLRPTACFPFLCWRFSCLISWAAHERASLPF